MMKWIRVVDELPTVDQLVLCIGPGGGLFIGRLETENPHIFGYNNTIHFYTPNSRGRHKKCFLWTPIDIPNVEDYK